MYYERHNLGLGYQNFQVRVDLDEYNKFAISRIHRRIGGVFNRKMWYLSHFLWRVDRSGFCTGVCR